MKKVILFLSLSILSICSYSQGRVYVDCSSFPTNDPLLDSYVSNFSNKMLSLRNSSVEYFNLLDRSQKQQYQNAVMNNDSTFFMSLSSSQVYVNNLAYLQTNFTMSFNTLLKLNPDLDSLKVKELLIDIIQCSLIKLSPYYVTEEELARAAEDCVANKKKCNKRADRNFGICSGATVAAGFFGAIFSFGASVGAAVIAYEACVVTYAYSLEDCKEDYKDCIAKEQ
jgi:hypothetical protein